MDPDLHFTTSEVDRALNNDLSEDSVIDESNDENEDNYGESSEILEEFQDDTDEDPRYDPENYVNQGQRSNVFAARGTPSIRFRVQGPQTRNINANRGQPRPINRSVISSSDSESNDEEVRPTAQPNYKWKKIENETHDDFSHNFTFLETPGPKHCPPVPSNPIDYFDIFFTHTLLNMFAIETNRYKTQTLDERGANISPTSRLHSWIPTTLLEIKAFIIVLLNMGLLNKPTIKSYWSSSSSQSTPWFSKMFTRNRFESLLSFFHMVDNTKLSKPNTPGYNPCQKFQPLQDHCNRLFPYYYQAHEQLSIDESLIGTKSQTQLMQYLPNKHHHRGGVKLWLLCDSVSNYCLSFFCYKCKQSVEDRNEVKDKGLAHTVVNKLLTSCNYLKKGHHIFTDNYYTSIPLLDYLYENQTFMTGTIKRKRKHLPDEVKAKLNVGQKIYCKLEGKPVVAIGYQQKKSQKQPLILLSSKPEVKDVDVTKRRHGRIVTDKKPFIVQNYCQYIGGINTVDMMLYTYLDERRSMKYWRKVAFNLFARMVLNSYVIYKESCKANQMKPLTRYAFIVSIIDSVTEEWLGQQLENETAAGNRPVGLDALPGNKQKTCWVCTPKGKNYKLSRKRSRYVCSRCNEGCHGTCLAKHICK